MGPILPQGAEEWEYTQRVLSSKWKSEAEAELYLVDTHLLASPQDCRSLLPSLAYRYSQGESQLQEGAPSLVLPPQTAASPAAPHQEATPNPGPGTGAQKVKGGQAGHGNGLQPSWPSGCVPGRRRGPLPGCWHVTFTSALGHRPSHPCSTDMDLETQGGLETCSKPALKRRSGP